MMKKILTILCLFSAMQTFAQSHDQRSDALENQLNQKKVDAKKEGWTKGGLLNIGVNEGILENWAAGGERMSLAVNGQFNGFLARVKSNTLFENTLDLAYGLNYVASNHFVPRKIDDRIDFSSRYGLQPKSWADSTSSKLKRSTYFTGLFRFQSQMTEGFNYEQDEWEKNPISEFLSPGYFTLALGAELRPSDKFSVFLSPLAGKMTVVKAKYTEFSSAYGVEKGKTSRAEFGAYLTAKYRTKLNKNINYNTRLDLYSNYLAKDTKENGVVVKKDNPGNIDILWDNLFVLKITKYIGASLGFTLFYDNDQPGQKNKTKMENGVSVPAYGPLGWLQLKQVMNIGFSHKF